MKIRFGLLGCGMALWVMAASAVHAEPIIYPAQKQSQEQQDKDRSECRQWATQQTGVDPQKMVAAPPVVQTDQNQRQVLRTTVRGAAVGALGGAMGGEAGKGAAAGAAAGAVVGGVRKRQEKEAQNQAAAAVQQERNAQLLKFDKAFGACMEGRGYTVKF